MLGSFASALASALGQGDERICIAVLDGPVDSSHPCLQGSQLTYLETLVEPVIGDGQATVHGTQVASIIFGQTQNSVLGVAPSCRGMVVPIFADTVSDGSLTCSQLDLARAIVLAIENGAHVINISGGQLAPSPEPEPILAQAIESCARHNVLIVAAAGNDGCECLHIPAATPSVLAVGAMGLDGRPLASSNYGDAYRTQGILAPGEDVLVAVPGGETTRRSGTSYATPFVSGLAGLLASFPVRQGQPLDLQGIRAILLETALPCLPGTAEDCGRFMVGRVDVPAIIDRITLGGKGMSDLDGLSLSNDRDMAPADPTIQSNLRMQPTVPDPPVRLSDETRSGSAVSTSQPMSDAVSTPPMPSGGALRAFGRVAASECSCGCGPGGKCTCGASGSAVQKPALIYALGKIGYDFGSEVRRESFIQAISPPPD